MGSPPRSLISRQPLGVEEPLQVANAAGDRLDGPLALAVGPGAQGVAADEVGQFGGPVFDEAGTPPLT